ncbi:MAG: hypothetical protein KF709_05685 [Gemmatimonadaceae bacterium]|nr:hypothetical protein [Gemmatimonadaceae bacterium]
MSSPRRPAISLSWREGRFFDLWMLVHLVAGFTGATTNVVWNLTTPRVVAVAIALMLAWEVAEFVAGVRESWENRLLDIAIGLVGVVMAQWLVAPLSLTTRQRACLVALAVLAVLSAAGWLAFRRRTVDPDRQS